MKSLKGQIIWKILITIIIVFVIFAFFLGYLIQKKAEEQVIQNIEYIRDSKYKSLNKDNLATAFNFSSLNYTTYILDQNGKMIFESNYVVDNFVVDFCREATDNTKVFKKGGQNTYVTIKKNGNLCFVVEGTTNNSIILGQFVNQIFYILVPVFTFFVFIILFFIYRKVKKPILGISSNMENALFSKWENIKKVDTNIIELKDLEKYSDFLIDSLKDGSGSRKDQKIGELKDLQNNYLHKQVSSDASKFKLAVDSAADMIIIVDKFGYINYANPTLLNTINMDFSQIENKKITDIWHKEDDLSVWKEKYAEILKNKKPVQFSSFGQKKDGIKFEAEVKISPIKNKDGEVENLLIIERDVSEEKQKDRIKTEFISVVSHELRTPMTVIRGYSSLLGEGKLGELNEKQKEYIDKINSETGRLLELANDMLDLQKFESGKIELKFEKTSMPIFIDKIINDFTMEYNKKGLTLEKEDHLTNKYANVDVKYFERVITNLLTNAFKFTDKGGVKIFLLNPDDNNIVIAVKDTGMGVKDEALAHLFERFYQASGVMNRKQEGSGLGLSIVKTVTEAHKGMVWVESNVGVGTTFYIAIPTA